MNYLSIEHSLHSMVTSYLSKKSHLLLNHIPLYSTCLLSSSPQVHSIVFI